MINDDVLVQLVLLKHNSFHSNDDVYEFELGEVFHLEGKLHSCFSLEDFLLMLHQFGPKEPIWQNLMLISFIINYLSLIIFINLSKT